MNNYINRELSWLNFNQRVLEECRAPDLPAFERLRFIAIFTSNLDEFFMIRAGCMHDRALLADAMADNKTGMSAQEQLVAMYDRARELYARRDRDFAMVQAELDGLGVVRCQPADLTGSDAKSVRHTFKKEILPLLSPQIIDAKHPLPHLENKKQYLLCGLKNEEKSGCGLIPMPAALPKLLILPDDGQSIRYVIIEDVLLYFADELFHRFTVYARSIVRVTRNADIEVADNFSDEDIDYRDYVNVIIKRRERLAPIRLETYLGVGEENREIMFYLCDKLKLSDAECYRSEAPLDMTYADELGDLLKERLGNHPAFFHAPLIPQKRRQDPLFTTVTAEAMKRDVFLSYPFYSMEPYLLLLKEAAESPETVSIRITLYRMSNHSEVVNLLCQAAENGKEVTALVELKARFDESNNINWSRRLEEAGCHVIYGVEGLKVHAKITLITRHTEEGTQLITHLGTGNYNEKTAQTYTDVGIITSHPGICADAVEFFNNMTLGSDHGSYEHLLVAPHAMKEPVLALIRSQTERGKDGYIRLKMNGLTDKEILDALVEASRAGVSIDLIVRGICCLQPEIPGLTENVRVHSIVGRFLEHSRIYIFGREEDRRVFIASADLMTRNTTRRIEIITPIYDREIAQTLYEMTEIMLADNVKRRMLHADGVYRHADPGEEPIDSQLVFFDRAYRDTEERST